ADLIAFPDNSCLAERNRKISTWVFRAIVRLTVKMLVLEEHHGIVAAYGGSQQSSDVQRRGRHNHAEPGTMRKDRFAALAVIHRAAREIAADRHAQHRGGFEHS